MKKIIMNLSTESSVPSRGSNLPVYLNGWLMEQLDPAYVDLLHSNEVIFSQSAYRDGSQWIWEVNVLDETKGEQIADFLESPQCKQILLKAYDQIEFNIIKKNISMIDENYFADVFYRQEALRYLDLRFITPTAFKQNKSYVTYPDTRLMVQSLIMRYQSVFNEVEEIDEDFLIELSNALKLQRYHLRTDALKIHQSSIPGFRGVISFRLVGNPTVNRYLSMLFAFAEYAGIGIKTALGMGKVEKFKRGGKNG